MSSDLSLDTRSLEAALLYVEAETGRSVVESLNRAGKHVVIGSGSYPGAMQLTPKASRAKIDAVTDRQLAGAVILRAKRKGQWPISSAEIKRRVKLERKRRNAAIGYAAYAGWNKAAKAMGGTGLRKGITGGFERSEAARGDGHKATAANLLVELTNTAPAIERIGVEALQQAIDNAAKDLEDYVAKKLGKTFKEVS